MAISDNAEGIKDGLGVYFALCLLVIVG